MLRMAKPGGGRKQRPTGTAGVTAVTIEINGAVSWRVI